MLVRLLQYPFFRHSWNLDKKISQKLKLFNYIHFIQIKKSLPGDTPRLSKSLSGLVNYFTKIIICITKVYCDTFNTYARNNI